MKKIKYIVLIVVLVFLGCENEKPKYTIPASRVNFTINTSYLDNNLNNTGNINVYLRSKDKANYEKLVANVKGLQVLNGDRAGISYIGYSGLLVINTGSTLTPTPFAIFDLCCPVEGLEHVRVLPTNNGIAKCPQCNSTYDIIFGTGIPKSGPALEKRSSLQSYYIAPRGQNEFRIYYGEN